MVVGISSMESKYENPIHPTFNIFTIKSMGAFVKGLKIQDLVF